jgi:hypothetical protein
VDKQQQFAVQEYQCPGCVNGPFPTCFRESDAGIGCGKHCAGTMRMPSPGLILLGMPKGFNRLGPCEHTSFSIFRTRKDGWEYDFLGVPVWKFKDEHGNTLVRGFRPRINHPFIHIFLEDCMDKIECIEITPERLAEID